MDELPEPEELAADAISELRECGWGVKCHYEDVGEWEFGKVGWIKRSESTNNHHHKHE